MVKAGKLLIFRFGSNFFLDHELIDHSCSRCLWRYWPGTLSPFLGATDPLEMMYLTSWLTMFTLILNSLSLFC